MTKKCNPRQKSWQAILHDNPEIVRDSVQISRNFQSFTKDAYIASYAQFYNISHIALNDKDFSHVPLVISMQTTC